MGLVLLPILQAEMEALITGLMEIYFCFFVFFQDDMGIDDWRGEEWHYDCIGDFTYGAMR